MTIKQSSTCVPEENRELSNNYNSDFLASLNNEVVCRKAHDFLKKLHNHLPEDVRSNMTNISCGFEYNATEGTTTPFFKLSS